MTPHLTVAICTHNPRSDYLHRTLEGLRAQTLPVNEWELLLIDNASNPPAAADLSWHPAGRVVPEPIVGLTSARLRAIAEAKGEVLVFVDDDNVLAPDYLQEATRIGRDYPWLGAWGAGRIVGEFETPPPAWAQAHLHYLALGEIGREHWGNFIRSENTPCGAGLCVRRPLAQAHAQRLIADPSRPTLGRTGQNLLACEDTDLAFTVVALGHGLGKFPRLQITHLIPARRLTEDYLTRIAEGGAYSEALLFRHHGHELSTEPDSFFHRLARWRYERSLDPRDRRVRAAHRRGRARARG
jgi:glycosyltransferase involved in cell wall biosynthesis